MNELLLAGDTFIDDHGRRLLIISAKGFNLKELYWGATANYTVIDVTRGYIEAYYENVEDIYGDYDIKEVIPNLDSWER